MNQQIPPRSKRARLAGILERWLKWSVMWGTRVIGVGGFLFGGYVAAAWILTIRDSAWAPAEFLSLTGDPGFVLTSTLVSLFVVQTTASLIMHYMLTGIGDDWSRFVVLMSYIGLGSGAGALRVLLPYCLSFVGNWL